MLDYRSICYSISRTNRKVYRCYNDEINENLMCYKSNNTLKKLNKSLAQNVSICIGRLAMAYPEKISKFIDSFLKQFCLSLRVINNSKEKQEAFTYLVS